MSDKVKIGGYYYVRERFESNTVGIMKIEKLGDTMPQRIFGTFMNISTGRIFECKREEDNPAIFACQIKNEVDDKKLSGIKDEFCSKISSF
jgi:hypothetical protein